MMVNYSIPKVRGPMGLTLVEAQYRLAQNMDGRVKTEHVRKKIDRLRKEIDAIRFLMERQGPVAEFADVCTAHKIKSEA